MNARFGKKMAKCSQLILSLSLVCSNALFNLAVSNSAAGAVCQNGFEICTHPFEDLPTLYRLDSKAYVLFCFSMFNFFRSENFPPVFFNIVKLVVQKKSDTTE